MKNTIKAIEYLGYDNNMRIKPKIEWPPWINYDWIEKELSKLDDNAIETIMTGEYSKAQVIIKENNLEELDKLFNEIFDGDLNKYFYG